MININFINNSPGNYNVSSLMYSIKCAIDNAKNGNCTDIHTNISKLFIDSGAELTHKANTDQTALSLLLNSYDNFYRYTIVCVENLNKNIILILTL